MTAPTVVLSALSKVDSGAADLLARSALVDAFSDSAAAYLDTALDELAEAQRTYVPVAKREFLRGYVEQVSKGAYPSEEWVVEHLGLVEAIAKAQEQWTIDGKTVTMDVSRDNKGRFSRSTTGAKAGLGGLRVQEEGLEQRPSGKLVAPKNLAQYVERAPDTNQLRMRGGIKDEERRQAESYVGAYKEAQKLQDELKTLFGDDAKHVRLVQQIDDLSSGRTRLESIGLDDIPTEWDPTSEQQSRLMFEADRSAPGDVKSRVAQANTAGAVMGTMGVRAATSPQEMQAVLDSLKGGRGEQAPSQRRYKMMSAMGGAMERMAPGSTAAQLMQTAGKWGPEAQEALGPYMERAAYRFRGTETRVDRGLTNVMNSPDMEALDASATDDSQRMQARRDVAGQVLLDKIPSNKQAAELARRSGSSLPSQGVLIDADGDVVSQSVGVGPDHYVPFDLKTMKNLNGGQYVRTRVLGGLTPEDIHAVLVGNGRAASVVSGSGRFELELDPDLRGKRRFNDKVMVMADRYERILDAVADSGMYAQDLPAEDMEEAAERASMLTGKTDGKEFQAALDSELDRKRGELSRVTTSERQDIVEAVDSEFANIPGSAQQKAAARNEAISERMEQLRATKVRQLKLNHEGYKLALETLQQQFPHAIRSVSATTLEDFAPAKGAERMNRYRSQKYAADQGYVGPTSGNRPRSEADRKKAPSWSYYESQRRGGEAPTPSAVTPRATQTPTEATKPAEGSEPKAPAQAQVPESSPLGAAVALASERAKPEAGKAMAAWASNLVGQLPEATKGPAFQQMALGAGNQTVAGLSNSPLELSQLMLAQGSNSDRAVELMTELASNAAAQRTLTNGSAAKALVDYFDANYENPSEPDWSGAGVLADDMGPTTPERKAKAAANVQRAFDQMVSLARASNPSRWAAPPSDITTADGSRPLALPEVVALPNGKAVDAFLATPEIARTLEQAQVGEESSASIGAAIDTTIKGAKSLSPETVQRIIDAGGPMAMTDEQKNLVSVVTGTDPSQAFAQLRSGGFSSALPRFLTNLHRAYAARTAKETFEAIGMGGEETAPKVPERLGKRAPPEAPLRRLAGLPVLPEDDPRVAAVRKSLRSGRLRSSRRR